MTVALWIRTFEPLFWITIGRPWAFANEPWSITLLPLTVLIALLLPTVPPSVASVWTVSSLPVVRARRSAGAASPQAPAVSLSAGATFTWDRKLILTGSLSGSAAWTASGSAASAASTNRFTGFMETPCVENRCAAEAAQRSLQVLLADVHVRLNVDALLDQRGEAVVLADHRDAGCRLGDVRHGVRHVEGAGAHGLGTAVAAGTCTACTAGGCATGVGAACAACTRGVAAACAAFTASTAGACARGRSTAGRGAASGCTASCACAAGIRGVTAGSTRAAGAAE
eukprot:TRINITY_DN755_c0_g2_i1.p1 TRINITY_DN755_c0_g2~~TRINITY_DN755_c0_g2_i1.p1  ORF type:complete len:284 (+),score=34.11 TRINITY_DN755_c0_g2_i1:86-937(+)